MGLYLFVSAVYGHMAEAAGLEPTTTESKSVVLPLHHASIFWHQAGYLPFLPIVFRTTPGNTLSLSLCYPLLLALRGT